MTTTSKKSPLASVNMWAGIATLVAALFGYFQITPDAAAAEALSTNAHSIVNALESKNLALIITAAIPALNNIYHFIQTYFFKK